MIFNITNESVGSTNPRYDGIEGAFVHLYEMQTNWNAIMRSVGISEARYYVEHGADLFTESKGAFGNFIDKIIQWFKDAIERIKQIVGRFTSNIRAALSKNSAFIKKYEKKLSNSSKAIEMKGKDYSGIFDVASRAEDYVSRSLEQIGAACEDALDKYANLDLTMGDKDAVKADNEANKNKLFAKEENYWAAVGKVVGKTVKTESEFHTEMQKVCGLKDNESKTMKYTGKQAMEELKGAANDISNVTHVMNAQIASINGFIKTLTSIKRKLDKDEKKLKWADRLNENIKFAKQTASIATFSMKCLTTALQRKAVQAKSACIRVIQNGKEDKKEDLAAETPAAESGLFGDIFSSVYVI